MSKDSAGTLGHMVYKSLQRSAVISWCCSSVKCCKIYGIGLPRHSFWCSNRRYSPLLFQYFPQKYQKNDSTHWLVQAIVSNLDMTPQRCPWSGELCSTALMSPQRLTFTPDLTLKYQFSEISVGPSVMLPEEFLFRSSGTLVNPAGILTWALCLLQSPLLFRSKVLASYDFIFV